MKRKVVIIGSVLICISIIITVYTKRNTLTNRHMDVDQTRDLLEDSRDKWESLYITRYIIEGEVENFWNKTEFRLVYNNMMIEQISCSSPEFLCDNNKENYTVEGLFSRISRSLNTLSQRENISTYLYVKFDTNYGYPKEFTVDDPMKLEDETKIRITSFETKK